MSQWDDSENPNDTGASAPPAAAAGNPWTPEELAQSQQWANQYYTSHQIPNTYGTPDDLANGYVRQRQAGLSHADAMAYMQNDLPGILGWDKYRPNDDTPTPTPAPTPTGGSGSGGSGTGTGSLIQPFTTPYAPAGSASPNPTPLPTIGDSVTTIPGAPAFPTIPKFSAPTLDEAMADPGYKFTLQQGNDNLTNWLSSRGMQNDSSAAKAFIDYGQGAATTQYGNVWDRDLRAYDENVGTQYVQPWQAQYQNWMSGTVNPTMTNFQTQAANTAHLNDVSWQDNWNKWLQDWNVFRDQRDSTFNKQFQVATA